MKLERQAMYALVNKDGTAMAETALCSLHYPGTANRKKAFWAAEEDSIWQDCTDNDALECMVCGGRATDVDDSTLPGINMAPLEGYGIVREVIRIILDRDELNPEEINDYLGDHGAGRLYDNIIGRAIDACEATINEHAGAKEAERVRAAHNLDDLLDEALKVASESGLDVAERLRDAEMRGEES